MKAEDLDKLVAIRIMKFGRHSTAITDDLFATLFARARPILRELDFYEMARAGVLQAVMQSIKRIGSGDAFSQSERANLQAHFGDKFEGFEEITSTLPRDVYCVPSRNSEYMHISVIARDKFLLDEARKFLRGIGVATIKEAERLDDLYHHLYGDDDKPKKGGRAGGVSPSPPPT